MNKKKYFKMLSAEFLPSMLSIYKCELQIK